MGYLLVNCFVKTMARIRFRVLRAVCRPTIRFAVGGTLLAALAALAACSGPVQPPPAMHVSASVAERTLRLAVRDIPPGREITALVLVGAGGSETPARSRERTVREESSGGNAGPGVAVGASGGSSSSVDPYISLGYLFRNDDKTRRSQRITAEIPIVDPAAYAAGYRDWRIEVRYRDNFGDLQRASIPAPPP